VSFGAIDLLILGKNFVVFGFLCNFVGVEQNNFTYIININKLKTNYA